MEINKKPKVLFLVDNGSWCWFKTMQDMAHCLYGYECTLMSACDFLQLEDYSEWDFIYCRGSIHEFVNKDNKNKLIPFISTLCTGGKLIDSRMDDIREHAKKGWAIIVQNKLGYHRCKEEGYHRIILIPNGVNTYMYRPALQTPTKKLIGIAGNMVDRAKLKGFNYLKPAVKGIKGITLACTSSKNPLNYEQMAVWYQHLTIYAQPSESEGCSNSVMEAMASGLPCLICDGVGYHGEVCLDATKHDNGEVIFVKRNAKDIKEKIEMLLNDKELYDRVSRNARNFALQHDWKYISQKYKQVFDEFIPELKKLKEKDGKPLETISVKVCEDYVALAEDVYEFMSDRKIEHTIKNIMNILRMKGYMK